MIKQKRIDYKKYGYPQREEVYAYYYNKYYNLFMNSYKWTGIEYQEINFIMRKFWSIGSVACYKLKETEGSYLKPEGQIIFTQYTTSILNIYDFPIWVNLVNNRNASFIPSVQQRVDEDVVLGYCQRNFKPIEMIIKYYVKKITDVEMVMNTNLIAHKNPLLAVVSDEDENAINEILNKVLQDDPVIFTSLLNPDKLKQVSVNAQYIIDKLYAYKIALENELKEFLGINSLGSSEKKEHLITSEVEVNNMAIQSSKESVLDCLKEFCERIKKVFGVEISVESNQPDEYLMEEQEEDNEDVSKQDNLQN
jgi:hypothetical protein